MHLELVTKLVEILGIKRTVDMCGGRGDQVRVRVNTKLSKLNNSRSGLSTVRIYMRCSIVYLGAGLVRSENLKVSDGCKIIAAGR